VRIVGYQLSSPATFVNGYGKQVMEFTDLKYFPGN